MMAVFSGSTAKRQAAVMTPPPPCLQNLLGNGMWQ